MKPRQLPGEFMPDILTHILFAESVRDLIKDTNVKQFIDDNEKLYNLAAQGPDFLFYYKPWNPFSGAIRETGEKMHHIETARFFTDAVNMLKTLSGNDYEALLVYIMGFMCHYYCDKSAHPYVYSMIESGCYTTEGDRKKLTHYEIEATIDTRLWNEEKRLTATRTNVSELLKIDELPVVIAEYLSKYIYDTQSIVISSMELNKSVSNMMKVLDILFDPEDKKKKVLNKLPLPRKCYIDNAHRDIDVLNLKKRQWKMPGHEEIAYELSVGEIFTEAIEQCSKIINLITDMLENGSELNLYETIPNEDYCTREPL